MISTPTSVASVKGTDFSATSDPVLGDIFLNISGLLEVLNKISGMVFELSDLQMGSSNLDGTTEVTTYVLIVGELLSVSDNLLTMEPAEFGEGEARIQFNGQIALTSRTSYAGPEPVIGSMATVSGTANDDGSATAVQVIVEEIEEELEEIEDDKGAGEGEGAAAEEAELRIRFINQDGTIIKELVIIYK